MFPVSAKFPFGHHFIEPKRAVGIFQNSRSGLFPEFPVANCFGNFVASSCPVENGCFFS
jgi:hypothetical protein